MATRAQPIQTTRPAWRHRFDIDRIFGYLGYVILIFYSFIALFPILVVVTNSFKEQRQVFREPYALPDPISFGGYETVLLRADFLRYFLNSFVIIVVVLFLVLLCGAMAAFTLSEYRFFGNTFLNIFFALGIMIPIRLGTVSLIEIMRTLELHGTILALILVYTAWGLPITIFIMSGFMRDV
ncbi:MAG: carbohydrate ABC transporter permease, partial [Chloroflexi bacterium]|nr:carbohydrate ABC transporter permease [Chloroflexota bacterium]